ncbi:MAG: radical SAM protein [Candidatus Omnitrophica bacterium]|nr:radical SAM protein [Candidatus Omnitrophota bacterium]
MTKCINCAKESRLISQTLGVCLDCIRKDYGKASEHIQKTHSAIRKTFGLPDKPPKGWSGASCEICVNKCNIPPGGKGYCGIRENERGKISGPTEDMAYITYYHDQLPTNCVAGWACPGGTGSGYPEFCHKKSAEIGYKNLAVFYLGCSLNCLFCQNFHFREELQNPPAVSSDTLLKAVDELTSCICYFGGDPSPQLPHSIAFSRRALDLKKGDILRICWETNGTMDPKLLSEVMDIALTSGGCVKFDLKAYSKDLNIALCGITNKRTLDNFSLASKYVMKRKVPPVLTASTLLVPGYIDREEVYNISRFIAGHDPDIPYSLLGFGPDFFMRDLPFTSKRHADECAAAAREAGLTNVNIGNYNLLGIEY